VVAELKTLFPHKLADVSFTDPKSTVGLQLLKLCLSKIRFLSDGVTTIKPGQQTNGNARMMWSDTHPSSCSLHQEECNLENTQGSLQSRMPGSNSETRDRFCDGLGSHIVVQYSVGSIITLHDRITAMEYVARLGNQVHPLIQTLFPSYDSVFQDDSALHSHT
jgi:hypothetical protein